jgi:hypothetical protein
MKAWIILRNDLGFGMTVFQQRQQSGSRSSAAGQDRQSLEEFPPVKQSMNVVIIEVIDLSGHTLFSFPWWISIFVKSPW